MTRAIYEQSATTAGAAPYWTFAGTWAQGVADANASGGSYASSSTAGATATLTIPAATGITGILPLCSRTGQAGVLGVTVDGVAQPDWAQNDYTTAAATAGQTFTVQTKTQPVAWQRTGYQPIPFAAPNAAHTVVFTVVAGPVTIDAVEAYVAAGSATAGRVTTLGHSVAAGYTTGGSVSTAQRFPALLAAAIGGAEDNHAYTSSALIMDSNGTGLTPPAVGWLQAEGLNATVGGSDSYDGGAHWWGRTPEVAILLHGLNDCNSFDAADPGGGLGYARQLFAQRARECIWRMNLNSPATVIVVVGVGYVVDANAANQRSRIAYANLLSAVAAEPTMAGAIFVPTWGLLLNSGGGLLLDPTDQIHPMVYGHQLMARETIAALFRARARPAGRVLAF